MTNNGTVQNGMDGENLAAFCGRLSTIIYSPPSFPVRSPQGVCDTPLHFLANKISYACRRHFPFALVRAYAIRPYIFWQTRYNMPAAVIPCSLTSGRMRYAPTIFGKQTIICLPPSFPVRLREGVCDTPLQFLANKIKYACRRHSLFAHLRAYAIRPHNFWRKTKYIMVTLPAYFAIVSGDGSAVANGSI